MSFDLQHSKCHQLKSVSIPFEQGDVFRQRLVFNSGLCSYGLNPFRAGRCLSTRANRCNGYCTGVSIPFEQGDVFRPQGHKNETRKHRLNPFRAGRCLSTFRGFIVSDHHVMSQSLSSRAMSFDLTQHNLTKEQLSQSLSSRAMSFD